MTLKTTALRKSLRGTHSCASFLSRKYLPRTSKAVLQLDLRALCAPRVLHKSIEKEISLSRAGSLNHALNSRCPRSQQKKADAPALSQTAGALIDFALMLGRFVKASAAEEFIHSGYEMAGAWRRRHGACQDSLIRNGVSVKLLRV